MNRYFIKMAIASILSMWSYQIRWWAPFLVFPGCILVVPDFGHPKFEELSTSRVHFMRWVFYILATTYVISQVVIFQKHIDSWYGWFIGAFLSWGAAGICAARLETWLLWRQPISNPNFFARRLGRAQQLNEPLLNDYGSVPHETKSGEISRDALIEKAKDAPICFRVLMESLQIRFEEDFPQLFLLPKWSTFVMTATVGGCISLALRLHFDVLEEARTPIEIAMRESLQRRFPNSEHLYEDCYRFVTDGLLDIPRPERGRYIFPLIALWVITSITGGTQIEKQESIVAQLAYRYQNETAGYWKAEKVHHRFKEEASAPKIQSLKIFACPHCGAEYNPKDYRQDASEWLCAQCRKALPKN